MNRLLAATFGLLLTDGHTGRAFKLPDPFYLTG